MPEGQRIDRNIFKRRGIYYIRYTDAAGKQRVRSTRTRDKKAAYALLAKEETAAFEGREFPDKARALRLGRLADLWAKHVAPKPSAKDYGQRMRRILEYFGEKKRVDVLTHEELDQLRDWLSEQPGRAYNEFMKPATIQQHFAALRAACNWAVRAGHFQRSPMAGYKVPKVHNERDRIVMPEELDQILAAAPKPDYPPDTSIVAEVKLAVVIAHETSMRLGEIIALDWSQVSLRQRLIRLKSGETKTGHGRRVPLSDRVVEVLTPLEKKSGRMFTLKKTKVSQRFGEIVRELRIVDPPCFHDLRHTAATNLRRAGVDLFTLQAITGHKTLEMLRRYQSVTDDDLHDAVKKLSGKSG